MLYRKLARLSFHLPMSTEPVDRQGQVLSYDLTLIQSDLGLGKATAALEGTSVN